MKAEELRVKIFADGADKARILELSRNPLIKGFTTNPTLMRQAGVSDYEIFAKDVLEIVCDRPISFEVFSDEFDEMKWQAKKIAGWGENVYVKIPITNTRGESSCELVGDLARSGVKLNVTAILTMEQVRAVAPALAGGPPCYVSVFAGRIADAGCDPVPVMRAAVEYLAPHSNIELIWASPRELLNIVQADRIGCHVITVTPELLKKLPTLGRDLAEFSLDTVRMFYRDATAAGFNLMPDMGIGGRNVSSSNTAAAAR
jgi:transaldolase